MFLGNDLLSSKNSNFKLQYSNIEKIRFELNDDQKKLYQMAVDQINHNYRLIKHGTSFKEFTEKSWKLPEQYYGNRYSCMLHGIGLCDEWPQKKYPTDG